MEGEYKMWQVLFGVVIGVIPSLATVLVQQIYQTKRELIKNALLIAIKDYESAIELLKQHKEGGAVAPVSAYLIYHVNMLKALSKGSPNKAKIEAITREFQEIRDAFPGAPPKEQGNKSCTHT